MATTGSQDQHIQCQGWDSRVTGPAKVLPALARTPAHLWNDQQHPGEVLATLQLTCLLHTISPGI